MRDILKRLSWHLGNFSDWLYFVVGGEKYLSPHYCEHCGKWNFEEVETL